ncbi:ribonuclease HII [Alphaproteobacteria bacterium]|nr:ribonuclease HII [Alphaproteobacteria bacterium]
MVNFDFEMLCYNNNKKMIGVDEAGRGSWAGPLVAAACWIDFNNYKSLHPDINDSKKLKSKKRKEIIHSLNKSIKYSTGISTEKEIDLYGLTFANSLAMKRSMFCLLQSFKNFPKDQLHFYIDGKYKPDFSIVEITSVKQKKIKLTCNHLASLIKGDSKSKTIALASIIAKETRDAIMRNYSLMYPSYHLEKNFGYGTNIHKNAILKYGICKLHRKSFKPIATICSQQYL